MTKKEQSLVATIYFRWKYLRVNIESRMRTLENELKQYPTTEPCHLKLEWETLFNVIRTMDYLEQTD